MRAEGGVSSSMFRSLAVTVLGALLVMTLIVSGLYFLIWR